jgi:hypothetical protein
LQASDFWPAFAVVALISAASAIPMAWLDPDAGAEMSGQRRAAESAANAGRTAMGKG